MYIYSENLWLVSLAFRRLHFANFQNHELYEKVVRFFLFIVYSTKLPSTNQNAVTVSFVYISSDPFMFTSETFETLRPNAGNLRKTLVEPRTPSKFFGSSSEIFGRLRVNFGKLRKSSGLLRESSEVFGCFLAAFRSLLISENFLSTSESKSTNWINCTPLVQSESSNYYFVECTIIK